MATSRELLAFAYVAENFTKTGDIVHGILKLLAPVIAKRAGTIFVAEQFADDVRRVYDIDMHPYVAEELAPRLADAGFLVERLNANQHATYENGKFELPEFTITERELRDILRRFAEFSESLLRPHGIDIARETLESGFLDRLVQPDYLAMMVRPDRASLGPRTLSLKNEDSQTVNPADAERQHLDYLSARFILDCHESAPRDFDLIVAISSGALASEVILTLQHPLSTGDEFEGLEVVVDGPLIMDALGLGQDGPVRYARLLLESLKRAKAKPVIFQHIIDEIEGAIRTPLQHFERDQEVYGPLARKLITNPAFAANLRVLLAELPKLIEDLGVALLPFSDAARMPKRVYFTETNEDRLAGAIGSYFVVDAKLRDARSVADVLRLRGAKVAKSITDAGIVFVTRNSRLANLSRKFLIHEALMATDRFPPCITDRYLAGILWITHGGGGSNISRERLIANCTAAVVPRRDVVTRMQKFLEGVDSDMAQRFEALMTNRRAEHFLMDRTIGDVTLINEHNLEEIYRDVELIAGAKVAEQKDSEIAALKTQHEQRLESERAQANEKLLQESSRALGLEGELAKERKKLVAAELETARIREADKARLIGLVEKCRVAGVKAGRNVQFNIGLLIAGAGIAIGCGIQFATSLFSSPQIAIIATIVLIGVGQILAAINYFAFPQEALARFVSAQREKAARNQARVLGIEAEYNAFRIDWRTGQIALSSQDVSNN